MNKLCFPKVLLFFIIMIGVANALAEYFFLYWRLPWLDVPMHFLGGIWIGLTVLWLYYLSAKFKNIPENHRKAAYVYFLAGIVALVIGIFWEIFEFNLIFFITFNEFNGFYDTAGDILFAVIGAIFSAKYFVSKEHYKKQENKILNN